MNPSPSPPAAIPTSRAPLVLMRTMASFVICLLIATAAFARAHVFVDVPPTRALCFHQDAQTDTVFRAHPCGRASVGILGVLVAGADVCLRFSVTVPHSKGSVRVSLAPGTAGVGTAAVRGETPIQWGSFDAAFDDIILANWTCAELPGGCASSDETGTYSVPVRLPVHLGATLLSAGGTNNSALGGIVATLQLRQYAPEFDWYYHDCSDVLVVHSVAAIPTHLQGAWAEIRHQCAPGSFTPRPFPFNVYVITPIILGIIGLAMIIALGSVVGLSVRAARQVTVREPVSSQPTPGTDKVLSAVSIRNTLRNRIWSEIRLRWRILSVILGGFSIALVAAGGVLASLPSCAFRPSPGFGP
jgi:hypothetical protein